MPEWFWDVLQARPGAVDINGDPVDADLDYCRHRSDTPINSVLQRSLGLSMIRLYYTCAIGFGEVEGYVCRCGGCGPDCKGFEL